MNTFESLNTYSNNTITFTDNRPSGILLNYPTARDIDTTITSKTLTVLRRIEIEEIIKPDIANVEFIVDVSSVTGTTVAWDTVPSGMSLQADSGVYTIRYITSIDNWDTVKAPTITVPDSFSGSFFYTCTIRYYDNSVGVKTYEWQVGTFIPESQLDVVASAVISPVKLTGGESVLTSVHNLSATPSEIFLTITDTGIFQYTRGDTDLLTEYTQIDATAADPLTEYTVEIEPEYTDSISTVTTSAPYLSNFSFNSTTKVVTLVGTLSEVNGALENLTYYWTGDSDLSFSLTYTLTVDDRPIAEDTIIQQFESDNVNLLAKVSSDQTFSNGVNKNIDGGPQITELSYTGDGYYTFDIYPNDTNAINNLECLTNVNYQFDRELLTSQDIVSGAGTNQEQIKVSNDGEYVVFGNSTYSPESTSFEGRTVFARKTSSGTVSILNTFNPLTGNSKYNGYRVAINGNGDRAVSLSINSGNLNIYTYTRSSSTWSQHSVITSTISTSFAGLEMSNDGSVLFLYDSGNEQINVYDWNNGWSLRNSITGLTGLYYNVLDCNEDGSLVIAGSADDQSVDIFFWNGTTWSNELGTTGALNSDFGRDVAIAPNGDYAVVYDGDNSNNQVELTVYSRSNNSYSVEQTLTLSSQVPAGTVAMNNNLLVANISGDQTRVYKLEQGNWVFSGVFDGGSYLDLSKDGLWTVQVDNRNDIGSFPSETYLQWYLSDLGIDFDNTSKTLTLQGTKTKLNNAIDDLRIYPDTSNDFDLIYEMTSPTLASTKRNQRFTIV